VITWPNGTFGVGKTTTARQLAAAVPNSRVSQHPAPRSSDGGTHDLWQINAPS
jgi:hypothetical protein